MYTIFVFYLLSEKFNNSIQFHSLLFYVPSQQPQGELQTQHSVHISNYIMDKNNIKSKTN
jgi:hypothetical protein